MEQNNTNTNIYKIIIALLLVIIIILSWRLVVNKNKLEVKTVFVEKAKMNNNLQSQLDSLLAEHEKIKGEYGTLSNNLKEKDEIIQKNASEIRRLIAKQGDYNQIKHKLDLLRGIAQGYIRQIDSLYTVNRELKEENVQIKTNYQQEQQKNVVLSKDREDLKGKVSKASVLKAYNITAKAVVLKASGSKEKDTEKARRADKLKVCFTLSENLILTPGMKTIYVRIARPDNKILVKGKSDEYSFMFNGEKLQYSIREDVNYQNQAMDICTYWINREGKSALQEGKYFVSVFCDNTMIGEGSIVLK